MSNIDKCGGDFEEADDPLGWAILKNVTGEVRIEASLKDRVYDWGSIGDAGRTVHVLAIQVEPRWDVTWWKWNIFMFLNVSVMRHITINQEDLC